MVGLRVPSPNGSVPFEPARDKPASFSASEKIQKKHKSVVTEQLVPKVIRMDGDGRPMSHHETVPLQTKAVEPAVAGRPEDAEAEARPSKRRYEATPERKAKKAEYQRRYQATPDGKAKKAEYNWRYRAAKACERA